MMVLFAGLVVAAATIGERRTGKFVKVIDVPVRILAYGGGGEF